jgi:hypothetical protein
MTIMGVAAVVVSVAVAGCTSSTPSPVSSTTSNQASGTTSAVSSSPSAAPRDYTGLLIPASDINIAGDTFSGKAISNSSGNGVAVMYVNPDASRRIVISISVDDDATQANAEVKRYLAGIGEILTGGTPHRVTAVPNGMIVSGTAVDHPDVAVTVLMFVEGRTADRVQFSRAATDSVPPEVVIDIGQKQDVAIKNGL